MGSNDELKNNNIKNRTCYFFDDIIKFEDFGNILIHEKSYKNILAYNISYKTLIRAKPLYIRFDKTDGYTRVYDGTRYLVLFGAEKYDVFTTGLDMLQKQRVVLHLLFLMIMQKYENLIHTIICL